MNTMKECGICGKSDTETSLVASCRTCEVPICEQCNSNGIALHYKRGYKGNFSVYCSMECVLDDTNWSPGSNSFDHKIMNFASPKTQAAHNQQIQTLIREHKTKIRLKKRFR